MTRPAPVSEAHRSYFDCPIRTGCAQNALVLRRGDLDLPFAGHNPDLLAILDPSLTASLGEIEAQSALPEQVKILIKRRIASGKPEIGDVARELRMSERSLQRRIAEHGASCSTLDTCSSRRLISCRTRWIRLLIIRSLVDNVTYYDQTS